MLLDVVECCWMLLDVVGCCWMLLDVVGCCWMLLDVVGCCWMLWCCCFGSDVVLVVGVLCSLSGMMMLCWVSNYTTPHHTNHTTPTTPHHIKLHCTNHTTTPHHTNQPTTPHHTQACVWRGCLQHRQAVSLMRTWSLSASKSQVGRRGNQTNSIVTKLTT